MSANLGMQNDVIARNHAGRYGLHDHAIRTAETRRQQAEAIADRINRVWTTARRALQRLINGKSQERRPPANGKENFETPSGASAGPASDRVRLAGLIRRFIVEPYARSRRRRIAIAYLTALDDRLLADIGLMRGQIELAVDGKLAGRGELLPEPDRASTIEDSGDELPLAA